jgi:hypothetical protein
MSAPLIRGECDCCGRGPRVLRFVIAYGIDTFACAECHGEPPDAFEEDDEYARDVEEHGISGWGR